MDFEVEEIFHNPEKNQSIFYKSDNHESPFEHHFVYSQKGEGFNTFIDQSKFLRFELAKTIHELSNTKTDNKINTGCETSRKYSDSSVQLTSGDKVFIDSLKNELIIRIQFVNSNQILELNLTNPDKKSSITKCINEDLIRYENALKEVSKKEKTKLLELLNQSTSLNEHLNSLSETDLFLLHFENSIISEYNKPLPSYSLTNVLNEILEELNETEWLFSLLMENFDYVYNTEECLCGSDGCFFDVLKGNQREFFKDNYLNQDGLIDENKIKADLNKLWSKLNFKEKIALKYLATELQNSTLLNLYFLHPEFNLSEYQRLMCMPYQPDSEDEIWLRSVTTFAAWLAKS